MESTDISALSSFSSLQLLEEPCQQTKPRTSVPSNLPLSVPLPSDNDIRLFFLAIQDNHEELADKLLDDFPVLVVCTYFDEAPVIAAIRASHEQMVLFLLENGALADCSQIVLKNDVTSSGQSCLDWYHVTARELAYEKDMYRAMEAIDYITGNYFPFLTPFPIHIEVRMPKKPSADNSIYIPDNFFSDTFYKPQDLHSDSAVEKKSIKSNKGKSKKKKDNSSCSDSKSTTVSTSINSQLPTQSRAKSLPSRSRPSTGAKGCLRIPSAIVDTNGSLLRKRPHQQYKHTQFVHGFYTDKTATFL